MIDFTKVRMTTSYGGAPSVDTFNGDIRLEQDRGRLAVYDPVTKQPRNIQDINGTHIYDSQGREMTRLDTLGLTTIEPATGRQRNRVGIASNDGRTIMYTSDPGTDIRDEGI